MSRLPKGYCYRPHQGKSEIERRRKQEARKQAKREKQMAELAAEAKAIRKGLDHA